MKAFTYVSWLDGYLGGGGDNVGSVEQIVPQERLKTSNVSYVYVVCGNEW